MRALARDFALLLHEYGFETVAPATSYAELLERLLTGEADAAWGPPMVCARVEQAGGQVALRAVRQGSVGYRAVLICRLSDGLNLLSTARNRRRPRAAWVDQHSMGGYVLARAHLRSLGLDPRKFLVAEHMAGSYAQAIADVLDGTADLTSTFASAADATRTVDGYLDIAGARANELRKIGYTSETPNDGIVLSPRLVPATAHAITTALRKLCAHAESHELLARSFDVDGFDEPPAGSYGVLLQLTAGD